MKKLLLFALTLALTVFTSAYADDTDLLYAQWDSLDRQEKYEEALPILTQAAELGDRDALARLGEYYYYGMGVEPDEAKARELFEKASDLGEPLAAYFMGYYYSVGEGYPLDMEKAFDMWMLSAQGGNADGQQAVGWMYETGTYVAQDYDQAFACTRKPPIRVPPRGRDHWPTAITTATVCPRITRKHSSGRCWLPRAGTSTPTPTWPSTTKRAQASPRMTRKPLIGI